MLIGGFQATTLSDFPGEVAAIIFTVGCNLRCGYCHNPQLVMGTHEAALVPTERIMDALRNRRGRLSGVVFTGGEPLLQPDLLHYCQELKAMGYRLKLDTNGSHPDRLQTALASGHIDYVAMDVKDLPGLPPKQRPVLAPEQLTQSIRCLLESGIAHEFRTTVSAALHDAARLCAIADTLRGGAQWWLQPARPGILLDPNFPTTPLGNDELERVCRYAQSIHLPCAVR